jgi:Protein of unknown function (DUF541)
MVSLAPGIFAAPGLKAAGSMAQESVIYRPSEYLQVSATCSMEVSPDRAVILGGVSSAALKPTDAVEQLDKELALMKSYVTEKHGEMQVMERVRTLKTPQPGREESEPPYQVVQRLQVVLPADAPVDAVLQKLIELGFDRFGDNILNNNNNRREAVVRFRVTNFEAEMKGFEDRCTADAWRQFCNPPTATRNCPSQTPPSDLDLQAFNVHSKESLLRPDGISAPWQVNFSRGQRSPEPQDLLGNVTVHLEGNIALTYHRPEATTPTPTP